MTDGVLADLFQALNLVAIERQPDHSYYLLTPAPKWLSGALDSAPVGERNTLGGAFPFLDDFLRQADGAWQAGAHASIVSSPFVATVDGDELLLRATALTVSGRALLVVERLVGAADTRPILQKAREHMLESEHITRQISRLHVPADTIAKAVTELRATPLATYESPLVERLATAVAALQVGIEAISGIQAGKKSS
jgi:hypothetical protein